MMTKLPLLMVVLATGLGLSLTAAAQKGQLAMPAEAESAKSAAPAPKMANAATTMAIRTPKRWHEDARECLKFTTNQEIHNCADKFF